MTHSRRPWGLVVFDLDGTLLRPATACEIIAGTLGRVDEMREFEQLETQDDIARAREVMAEWYRPVGIPALSAAIGDKHFAPGAFEGVHALQAAGLEVALASMTWDFAVEVCASRLGVRRWTATGLRDEGITHCWPEDKAAWATELRDHLDLPSERLAAVGDSHGDIPLLNSASLAIYVGFARPEALNAETLHLPGAAIDAVAKMVLDRWTER